VSRIILFVDELPGPGGMFSIVHESTVYATYHVTLMVHVCDTAHLPNWVWLDCSGGPAKLGLYGKTKWKLKYGEWLNYTKFNT